MASPDPIAFSGTERFEVRRRLGAGGMGIVYEAYDRERAMSVALKVMRTAEPTSLLRFKHELRALADVAHPNLVTLHELHVAAGTWFFTMELLDGVPFAAYVGSPADEGRLRSGIGQLAQGVSALHAANRLHRDIKPSNILVTREGRVVLLDFGVIAEIGGADRALVGTPAYAAPEQAAGEATPASDWYAMGVVLYELLTGTLPFRGAGRAILYDKQRYAAQAVQVVRPDAPADLAALCDALLARDPQARPDGAEVLRRLDVGHTAPVHAPARGPLLVGRNAALGVLQHAYDEAERGHGSVVHVRGASGIGKTALLDAFARIVERDREAVVLAGRCYPQESVPYKAVDSLVDALARFLATLSESDADAVLPRDIALLAQVFPVLAGIRAVSRARRRSAAVREPHELRRRAFAALRELLARIAETRPVVLVIDDVQWGDLDSAAILDVLMTPPDPPAVVLVLAYRAEDEGRTPLLRALRERRERLGATLHTVEITLEPLADEDSRALAIALTGSVSTAAAIVAESGGVPFLVHELAIAAHRGVRSIERAIVDRLAGLAETERTVLELVALAAKPIARDVLGVATAAEPGALERDLARLVAMHLVRVTGEHEASGCFESYHDRIREAVVAAASADRVRELHRCLADALEHDADDLEALVVHCEGAGEPERAGAHALAAADQAARALAFDRAAHLYAAALRLSVLDGTRARDVRTALGDALANAGHGASAAEHYLAATEHAPAAEATELRRRAAMQYLRTGRIESGLRVLDEVLAEVGGSLPRSPRRAIASLVWHRIRLRLRGLRFERRDPTSVSPAELARLDVLWTAATSLGLIDLVVGADFATRQALLALALGEPTRVARALTAEVMFLAAQGDRTRQRTEAVLARAETLIAEMDDPELSAWLAAARGLAEYQLGHFRRASELADEGGRRLREECIAKLWEVGGVEALAQWSLFYLGEFSRLSTRVDAAVEQARLRGNRFDAANFGTGLPALAWAVADRTSQGRVEVERVIAEWSPRGFHLQHYYSLLALASFELYDGLAGEARARIEAMWPMLVGSRLLICQSVAIEAHHLRGRAELATGDDASAQRRALGRFAGNPWADAMRALLHAGSRIERGEAIEALGTATEACVRAELAAFTAAARRRRGELLGGAEGAALVAAADRDLTERSVRAPSTFARMLVPIRAEAS